MKNYKDMYRIIIPVYNDGESLILLIKKIYEEAKINNFFFNILIIDDASSENLKINIIDEYSQYLSIDLIRLNNNLGHQKAIYTGLLYCKKHFTKKIIVMDSDGEDNPLYIKNLIKKSNDNSGKIIVAKRAKRKESLFFILFYNLYKILFYFLTGHNINFGNYSIINYKDLNKIIHIEKSYNHFAASLLKCDKNLIKLSIPKGKRYKDYSKMNFTSLISHGLDAISIFSKEAIIRTIIISIIGEFFLFSLALIVLYLRFFSNYLLMGQATSVLFFLIVISFVFIAICILLAIINSNKLPENLKYINYFDFVEKEKKII